MPSEKYALIVLPRAAQDMEGIFDYIATELKNKSAAVKQISDFQQALNRVCEMPQSCSLINNEYVNEKGLRKLIVNNYIVFYKDSIDNKEIQVIRVLYGMTDFESIL